MTARNTYLKDYGFKDQDIKKNYLLLPVRYWVRSAADPSGGTGSLP